MLLISYVEILWTCYGFIDESLHPAHVERNAESQTFIFNSYISPCGHISIYESWMEKVLCYKVLLEHIRHKVFVFARSGSCLCPWTNAWKWKWLWWINHDTAHIKEMFPPNSKVATEKKAIPQILPCVSLLFQSIFAFSTDVLLECWKTHHLALLCCGYMNVTLHPVRIVPCIWDRPKWWIHHLTGLDCLQKLFVLWQKMCKKKVN